MESSYLIITGFLVLILFQEFIIFTLSRKIRHAFQQPWMTFEEKEIEILEGLFKGYTQDEIFEEFADASAKHDADIVEEILKMKNPNKAHTVLRTRFQYAYKKNVDRL